MDEKFFLKISSDVVVRESDNKKVLLANVDNGNCIFISDECYGILAQAALEHIDSKTLISSIYDENSKNYLEKLIYKLYELKMFECTDTMVRAEDTKISIDVTNRCNLKCKHCCVEAGENKRGNDLETNELMYILKSVVELNPQSISISGGEPLVRNDFEYFSNYLRQSYKGNLNLMTNGVLINENNAKLIAETYNSVDISIDGVDENSCSLLRGKGIFNKIIRGIRLLQKYNCKNITGSMVLTRENYKLRERFLDFCKNELHIRGIVRLFEDVGRGKEYADELMLNMDYYEDINKYKEYYIKNKLYKKKPRVFACQGGKRMFEINHSGNIYPCEALNSDEFLLGNIFEIPNLREFIEHRKYMFSEGNKNFEKLKPYNLDLCKECKNNVFCFNCVNQVKIFSENKDKLRTCKCNKQYYDLLWEDYEDI